jgi:hypothetical protein
LTALEAPEQPRAIFARQTVLAARPISAPWMRPPETRAAEAAEIEESAGLPTCSSLTDWEPAERRRAVCRLTAALVAPWAMQVPESRDAFRRAARAAPTAALVPAMVAQARVPKDARTAAEAPTPAAATMPVAAQAPALVLTLGTA